MPRKIDPGSIKIGSGRSSDLTLDSNAFTTPVIRASKNGVGAHISEKNNSHEASSIAVEESRFYISDDVEGVLDELSALLPPAPPRIGDFSNILGYSGITDWGVLKMRDGGQVERGDIIPPVPSQPNADIDVYPIFHVPPKVAETNPPFDFASGGNDPITDSTFNIFDGLYTGGGDGASHFGAFARAIPLSSLSSLTQTMRILPSEGLGVKSFVLSGSVFPADRGVVALFYWPPEGDVTAFLAQDLTVRVVCALNLGQGVQGQTDICDGDPGGMFTRDLNSPFVYPGLASGQYDLLELHTGKISGVGSNLPAPFDIADPTAGQVRLGTDPAAGVTPVAGGIPILGGSNSAIGGGNDNNFFKYRLPYLDDYTLSTGLPFTPPNDKFRYFEKPVLSQDPGTDLTQAGNFDNFTKSYWTYQVARYRHRATFPTGFPVPPTPRDMGNYLLIHFRKERDFELYARDGILPNDSAHCYETYSSRLSNWSDPEDTINIATGSGTSEGYHVLRSLNYEDPEALETVTVTVAEFDYLRTQNEIVAVSGVHYFVPGVASSNPWTISEIAYRSTGYWKNSFRTTFLDGTGKVSPGFGGPNPAMLYLGRFSYDTGRIISSGSTNFEGQVYGQRIEFGYDKLDEFSSHGNFGILNAPQPADDLAFSLTPADPAISFSGDPLIPQFSTDAKVRVFLRSPLGFDDPLTSNLPDEGTLMVPTDGGKSILFHSTTETLTTSSTGVFGNFTVAPAGPFPSPAKANLETAQKDYQERFLDEVYRYFECEFPEVDPTLIISIQVGNLAGPGLPAGTGNQFTGMTVRIGTDTSSFKLSSWLQEGVHYTALDVFQAIYECDPAAQVTGLPDRNPPLEDGVSFSAPSSGVLIYPKTDYTNNFRPSVVNSDLAGSFSQPDYSAIPGVGQDAIYVRMFDASMSRSTQTQDLNGQPFFTLIVKGLKLVDFAYGSPGPGSQKIAILAKVPGYTTWMDIGRPDGGGPSKQDSDNDGAGCYVKGVETFDSRDPETGVWQATMRVNVGPAVTLFQNDFFETPVLIKVILKSAGIDFDFTQGGAAGTTDALRGLIGLEIGRETRPDVVPLLPEFIPA